MDRNICKVFAERVLKHPQSIAIEWKKDNRWVRISYGELYKSIKVLSAAISGLYGIKKGEKAAILISNRPEWPVVFFALLYAGAIPVPINQHGVFGEIENILADSECKIAFTEGKIPNIKIKTVEIDSSEFKHAFDLFPEGDSVTEADMTSDACIMYTSGTTSSPKGVVLSHGNLLSNSDSLYKLGLMKPGDGVVAVLPLYHTYALVVTTLAPLLYGGRVIYPGSMRSEEVLLSIKEARGAIFIGVPLIFNAFHKALKDSLKKMPGLVRFLIGKIADLLYAVRKETGINLSRYFFYSVHQRFGKHMYILLSGGSKLKKEIEIEMTKFGFTILNGYGLTETSPVLTMTPLKKPKIGSVGIPIENVELKIGPKNKKGTGEILVRGPNVMKGYHKKEELTRQVMENGWFKTGDIGYRDEEGYLFLTGRMNDLITLELGLNIYPDEIESVYSAGVPLKEICVFDAPSERGVKKTPVLWAVAVPDMEFFKKKGIINPYDTIREAFKKASRGLSIPERLMGFSLTLEVLPRTLLGKVKRREVKKLHVSGGIKETFPVSEKPVMAEDLEILEHPEAGKIIDCLKNQTKVKEITPRDSFELDLGIDLLGREELAFELEKKMGLVIEEKEMISIFTVGELIEHARKAKKD